MQASSIAVMAFLICALIIGLISNLVLCASIYLCRSLHTQTNVFVFSLALSDIQVCLTLLPFRVLDYLGLSLGKHACAVFMASDVLGSSTSIITLLATALERYVAVEFPYKYHELVTRKRATVLCICIWTYSIIWAGLSMIRWEEPIDVNIAVVNGKCINTNQHLVTILNAVNVFLPITSISLVYGRLWHTARSQANEIRARENGFETRRRRSSKYTRTVCIVYVTFLVCWLPNLILITIHAIEPGIFYSLFEKHKLVTSILTEILIVLLPPLNSVLNPFIYGLYNASFRDAFKEILRRRKSRRLSLSRNHRNESFLLTCTRRTMKSRNERAYLSEPAAKLMCNFV